MLPRETPGLTPGKKEDKMGQRASDTRVLHFDNVRVPAAQRLGAEGEGFKIAMATLDRTRPLIGALATGIARRALEESLAYAAERKAFGQAIGEFQAVQFMLADMAKDIEASRLLTFQSAWLLDQGMRASKQSSMAKCFATDAAMKAHDRRGPDLRRQRLYEGVPGREADARRQADADLRGDEPDPARRDRPRAHGAERRGSPLRCPRPSPPPFARASSGSRAVRCRSLDPGPSRSPPPKQLAAVTGFDTRAPG